MGRIHWPSQSKTCMIDQRSQEPSPLFENEMRVGPFAVLDFTRLSSSSGLTIVAGRLHNPGCQQDMRKDRILQSHDLKEVYDHIDFSRLDDTYPETVLPIEDASLQPLSFPHAPTTKSM
jgi:arginine metabolism regulation protein II